MPTRGHVRQRGRESWELVVSAGTDPNTGRRNTVRETVRGTRKQALARLSELQAAADAGRVPVGKATFGLIAAQWMEARQLDLSPTTARRYKSLLAAHALPRWSAVPVRKITAGQLEAWYVELRTDGGLSSASVRHLHAVVRQVLALARRHGYIASNPADEARLPRAQHYTIEPPGPADVVALMTTALEVDRADLATFVRLAATTGCRRGELCALRWFDLDGATLSVTRSAYDAEGGGIDFKSTKTHAGRRLRLDEATVAVLAEHRAHAEHVAEVCGIPFDENAYIFSDDPAGAVPWSPDRTSKRFTALCHRAGVKCRLHDLRHFAATQLIGAGVPVPQVAGRLGHANKAVTLAVYSHALEGGDELAADVLGAALSSPTRSSRRSRRA